MTLISQITRGLKNIKGLPGFGKLATKGAKTATSKPLSMSPLGDGLAKLAKPLSGPKKDVISLTGKTPKVSPSASHTLGRTSPAAPSTPKGGDQLARHKSTSTATTAATSSKGASGQAKATAAAIDPKALTPRERLETLRGYKTQQQEIMQNVKKLESNPHLTPEVKSQLLREEAIKLAGIQKKNAALVGPNSVYQKSAIQNQKILQANVKASQTGSRSQLPNPPVTTAQARDAAATRLMAQGRALRATQAQQEQQRLTQAWAADANAMAKPQVGVPSKNPYINDALESPLSSKSGPTFVSDIYPVRSFPGSP